MFIIFQGVVVDFFLLNVMMLLFRYLFRVVVLNTFILHVKRLDPTGTQSITAFYNHNTYVSVIVFQDVI